jgi:hypothetical protein
MNLLEAYMKDEVFVDFGSEPMYGSDQAYINYPIRFATVTFQLMATNGLSQIADRIRKDMGMRPMHPMDEFTDDTCDNEGWYDFYYGVNLFTENHSDTCISFVVVNSDSPDNEAIYVIDLSPDEQAALYNRVDEQCRKYLEKSCEELLKEADKELEETIQYEREHPRKDGRMPHT